MKKHLLVIRLSALGDVAMTLPVIYSVAQAHPDCHFTVATRPFFARMFINRPSNVSLFEVDYKQTYKGLSGTFKLLRQLASLKIDAVADLHNVSRSWTIDGFFKLRGIPVAIVNKERMARQQLLKKNSSAPKQKNYVLRYVEVFQKLGFSFSLNFKSIFESASPILPEFIKENECKKVGIAPFARYTNKTYPIEKMQEVVARLSEDKAYEIYLFGGKNEASILKKWEKPNVHVLAGQFKIEDELTIMSALDVMVSMDSANMHLASLAGTKVLSMWGSTTPACGFMGYGQDEENALCLNLPCQPCTIAGSEKCQLGHLQCLHQISPTLIVQKIKQMIKN